MITLSVKQPWAYLICSGLKDIENRTWQLPEKYKGQRVLIHASAKSQDSFTFSWDQSRAMDVLGENEEYQNSAIIGSVEIVECVQNHPSIWAESTLLLTDKQIYNWVLANPVLFGKPILNVKGKLGFWDYPMTEEEYMKLINL